MGGTGQFRGALQYGIFSGISKAPLSVHVKLNSSPKYVTFPKKIDKKSNTYVLIHWKKKIFVSIQNKMNGMGGTGQFRRALQYGIFSGILNAQTEFFSQVCNFSYKSLQSYLAAHWSKWCIQFRRHVILGCSRPAGRSS